MRIMKFAVALMIASAVQAQGLDEVVVTAQRAQSYAGVPAVTVRKPADYLVQGIRLINDSRSPDLRRTEIIGTIDSLLKRAADLRNVALSYGEGFLVPIDLSGDALQMIEEQKKSDTSVVDIYVKVTLTEKDDTKKRIADLRAFIKQAKLVGRTEIEPTGDIGLSVVNPEKYRAELLAKIAADNFGLSQAMGKNCDVAVSGLERRTEWQRTGVAELTLYIPYGVEISKCSPAGGKNL
jgi:hypothetical protein